MPDISFEIFKYLFLFRYPKIFIGYSENEYIKFFVNTCLTDNQLLVLHYCKKYGNNDNIININVNNIDVDVDDDDDESDELIFFEDIKYIYNRKKNLISIIDHEKIKFTI
ncbi:hypothetical protein PIROE2DRAFT_14647 [Piromyces sp. E2]|nr:hypothetical protein PIROE2DRAFT_14647 [Piromyces sp. E2]|eukprot:OUM59744.1 hypothetical protein PIROE2DRAFT_14647 [Piromyces sp. E2]